MKKLIITILAIFYLGSSSGATLHVHHCMGKLVEWGLSDNSLDDEGNCTNCGMKQGNSELCCKSQKQEFKLQDSYKAPLNVLQIHSFAIIPPSYFELQLLRNPKAYQPDKIVFLVPKLGKAPAFLRNCNFRI